MRRLADACCLSHHRIKFNQIRTVSPESGYRRQALSKKITLSQIPAAVSRIAADDNDRIGILSFFAMGFLVGRV
jgi:hypothetical protein